MLDVTEAQRDPTYVVGAAVDGFDEFVGCAGVEVLRVSKYYGLNSTLHRSASAASTPTAAIIDTRSS